MHKPDLCPAGHSLADVNAAHEAIIQHVRDLNMADAVGELRCLGFNLVERLAPLLSGSDELALRTFVSITQRFDAGEDGEGDLDDTIPPFPDAITPGKCSCHSEAPIYTKLNTFIDAQRAHAFEHEAPRPAGGGYL